MPHDLQLDQRHKTSMSPTGGSGQRGDLSPMCNGKHPPTGHEGNPTRSAHSTKSATQSTTLRPGNGLDHPYPGRSIVNRHTPAANVSSTSGHINREPDQQQRVGRDSELWRRRSATDADAPHDEHEQPDRKAHETCKSAPSQP